MPIRLFLGTRPGSGRPTAAIEQAGSPTASAFVMRWAAAVAAGEVYHVVVARSSPPVVGVGPGVMADGARRCFEGAGRFVGVRVGVGRAGDAEGLGAADFDGSSGVADRCEGSGVAGRGEGLGVADRAGGGGVAGPAFGVWMAEAPVAVRWGTGWRLGGADRVVGLCSRGAGSVVVRRAGGSGSLVGFCADGVGRVVGRRLGGVGWRVLDVVGLGDSVGAGVRRAVLDGSVGNVQDGNGFSVGRDRSFEAEGVGLGVPPSRATNAHTPMPPRTSTAAPPAIHGARRGGRR